MTLVKSIEDLLRDTEWRDTDLAPLAAITSGHLFLRRRGDTVYVEANWVATSATPDLVGLIPDGFKPFSPGAQSKVVRATDGALGVAITITTAGEVTVAYLSGDTPPSTSGAKWAAQWLTEDVFPTVLPGVAV